MHCPVPIVNRCTAQCPLWIGALFSDWMWITKAAPGCISDHLQGVGHRLSVCPAQLGGPSFVKINIFWRDQYILLSIPIYVFCRDQYYLLESIYFQRSILFVYVRSIFFVWTIFVDICYFRGPPGLRRAGHDLRWHTTVFHELPCVFLVTIFWID